MARWKDGAFTLRPSVAEELRSEAEERLEVVMARWKDAKGQSIPESGGDGMPQKPVATSGGSKWDGPERKAGRSSNASPAAKSALRREAKSDAK